MLSDRPIFALMEGWVDVTPYLDPSSDSLCDRYGLDPTCSVFIRPPAALLPMDALVKVLAGNTICFSGKIGPGFPQAEDRVLYIGVRGTAREGSSRAE